MCAHTTHVLNTGKLPNQHQLTLTENDRGMEEFSSSPALFPLSPAPLLLASFGLSLNSPLLSLCLLGIRFLLPDPPSSPPCSFLKYFTLSYMIISIWIMYFFFFTCTYLYVFSMHVILLKYVLKLARNCHQYFTQNMTRS